MIDTTVVAEKPSDPTAADRRIPGNPLSREKLNQLERRGKPFYYQLSRPDLGKGARSQVMVCGDAKDYDYLVGWHSRGTLVWAESASVGIRPSAPKPKPKPKAERDYSLLPGESTRDPEVVKATYKQGHFKYQFAAGDSPHRSRVMRCTDDDELTFILRQVGAGASVYLYLPDKPSG